MTDFELTALSFFLFSPEIKHASLNSVKITLWILMSHFVNGVSMISILLFALFNCRKNSLAVIFKEIHLTMVLHNINAY